MVKLLKLLVVPKAVTLCFVVVVVVVACSFVVFSFLTIQAV